MKRCYFITCCAILSQVLLAQTKPIEKKSSTNTTRVPIVNRPQNLLPGSDSPLKLPMQIQQGSTPQQAPKLQEHPFQSSLTTKGKLDESELIDPWGFVPTHRERYRWYRKITGFRVFIDKGTTLGIGKSANFRLDWYGSFGYQFNPLFYAGIGQGYGLSINSKESSAPTFVNSRVNFLDADKTPYLDIKAGYSFVGGKGLFLNPSLGMSFGKKRRAWNVGLGYSFQKANVKNHGVKSDFTYHGVSLRATYEFGVF